MTTTWYAVPPRQCAWCGQALDGPAQGILFFIVENQTVALHRLAGYSHGCCAVCRVRHLERWKKLRHRIATPGRVECEEEPLVFVRQGRCLEIENQVPARNR